MINGYRITDMHAHVYPDKIAEKAAAGTDHFYGTKAVHNGTVLQYIEAAKKAGIDRAVIHSVATTQKQVESVNRFIAETVSRNPELFIGLGTLHMDSEHLRQDIEQITLLGLRGVKLHPDIQGFQVDSVWAQEVYSLLEEYGLPILLHTGDSRYDNSNPDRMIGMLEKFPKLTFIGAHFGGWSIWEDASKVLAGHPNLYVDCSSSLPYVSGTTACEMIRRYGADKVLFGTDYPMWSPEREVDSFLALELLPEEKQMILARNAEAVFRIAKEQSVQ